MTHYSLLTPIYSFLYLGQSGWPLPVTEIEFPACTDKYRLIAMFLLDGTIIPSLQKNAPHLLSSPSCMTKSWARYVDSIVAKISPIFVLSLKLFKKSSICSVLHVLCHALQN